ncbi:MAG: UbiA family prenyltransferase [Pyrinomonadaceae bacterium]|nr:UbiA family prenyltransferase [Sphingobacteriaceae bacterium]
MKNNFIIKILVHSNVFIALLAFSISYIANILIGKEPDLILMLIAFSVMFFIYTINRFSDLKEDEINAPNRVNFIYKYGKYLLSVSSLAFISSILYAVVYRPAMAIYIFLPVLIGIIYSFFGLKRIFLMKNVFVGMAWGILALINGAYYEAFSPQLISFSIIVGVMMIINSTVFDLKDIEGDSFHNITTLPVKLGIGKTKIVCSMLNLSLVMFTAGLFYLHIFSGIISVIFLLYVYIFLYIYFAKPVNNPLFYGIFVDGELTFIALILMILRSVIVEG